MNRERSDTVTTVKRKQKITFEVLKKQEELRDWINEILEISLDEDLLPQLQDGVILCQLMNKISPGKLSSIFYSMISFLLITRINQDVDCKIPNAL